MRYDPCDSHDHEQDILPHLFAYLKKKRLINFINPYLLENAL